MQLTRIISKILWFTNTILFYQDLLKIQFFHALKYSFYFFLHLEACSMHVTCNLLDSCLNVTTILQSFYLKYSDLTAINSKSLLQDMLQYIYFTCYLLIKQLLLTIAFNLFIVIKLFNSFSCKLNNFFKQLYLLKNFTLRYKTYYCLYYYILFTIVMQNSCILHVLSFHISLIFVINTL